MGLCLYQASFPLRSGLTHRVSWLFCFLKYGRWTVFFLCFGFGQSVGMIILFLFGFCTGKLLFEVPSDGNYATIGFATCGYANHDVTGVERSPIWSRDLWVLALVGHMPRLNIQPASSNASITLLHTVTGGTGSTLCRMLPTITVHNSPWNDNRTSEPMLNA